MNMLLKKTLFWFVFVLFVYVLLFLFIDRPLDLWIHAMNNTWVTSVGSCLSFLANKILFISIITLSLIIVVIHDSIKGQQRWTKTILYICLSVLIAKAVGDCFKFLIGRYRPIMLFNSGLYGFHFFGDKWELISSPSGHTLRIFSAMTALALLFRRYRIAFYAIAILVGLSRIAVTAHYPSDVLFGAFIGITTAYWTRYYMYNKGNSQ